MGLVPALFGLKRAITLYNSLILQKAGCQPYLLDTSVRRNILLRSQNELSFSAFWPKARHHVIYYFDFTRLNSIPICWITCFDVITSISRLTEFKRYFLDTAGWRDILLRCSISPDCSTIYYILNLEVIYYFDFTVYWIFISDWITALHVWNYILTKYNTPHWKWAEFRRFLVDTFQCYILLRFQKTMKFGAICLIPRFDVIYNFDLKFT